MSDQKIALIVSAHFVNFVWRCGAAIALLAKLGHKVTVVCLSYGERGESAKLWMLPNMSVIKVKTERRKKTESAANALNADDGVRVINREDASHVLEKAQQHLAAVETNRERLFNGELGLEIYDMYHRLADKGLNYV